MPQCPLLTQNGHERLELLSRNSRNIFVGRQPVSHDPLRARLWAMVAIFGVLAADQAVKRLLLSGAVDLNGTMLIPGVANVAFAWNRGVSFSLLWQNSNLGSLLLSAGAVCIVAALLVLALRTLRAGVAVALRLLLGVARGHLANPYLDGGCH